MWWKQDFEDDRVGEVWVESWQEEDIVAEQKMMECGNGWKRRTLRLRSFRKWDQSIPPNSNSLQEFSV